MPHLILVRHGQSLWNAKNQFTGWVDVDLSKKGQLEAKITGEQIQKKSIPIHHAWSSVLQRSKRTLEIILKEIKQANTKIYSSWRLNERHYGALQGVNKDKAIQEYGADQVHQWRRCFQTRPPLLPENEMIQQSRQEIFKSVPADQFPRGESLQDTLKRVLPLWFDHIQPQLQRDQNVLIVAHGNSVRALLKHIQKIEDDQISKIEVATGTPIYLFI